MSLVNVRAAFETAILDAVQESDPTLTVVFDNTPFYAESGGQIGDTGSIESSSKEVIEIIDTIKDNDNIFH